MPFQAFNSLQEKYKSDADKYVENNFESNINEKFKDFNWDNLYRKAVEADSTDSDLFYWSFDLISKEVAKEVDLVMNGEKLSEEQTTELYYEAAQKAFYRQCAVMGIDSLDADKGWLSKDLAISKVAGFSDISRPMKISSWEANDRVKRIGDKISDGDVFSIYTDDRNYANKIKTLKPDVKGFLEKGNPKELTDYLASTVYQVDGRYDVPEKNQIDMYALASVMNTIFDRNDVSYFDVVQLIRSKDIIPTYLWDTQYFIDNHGPKVSDEGKALARKYHSRDTDPDSILMKIKDDITESDIMSHLINNHTHEVKTWEMAMNRFSIITGKDVDFTTARKMEKEGAYTLSHTKAYKALVDKKSNPENYSSIETNIQFDGKDTDFDIYIDCKSLSVEPIIEEFSKESLAHSELGESCYTPEGIRFSGSVFKELTTQRVEEIKNALVTKLEEIHSRTPLPGDVVEVFLDEGYTEEEIPVSPGYKGLVTDVSDSEVKLKGIDDDISTHCINIIKKYTHEETNEQTITM